MPSLHIDIENYPAIKRHLISYGKNRLEQTGKTLADGSKSRKKTPHKWFELQDTCAYHAEFECDKIVWIELVENGRFAYDQSGIYCEATTFIMTGNHLRYLCVLLNSKLIRWFLQQVAPTSGMGTVRWKKVYVEAIPIPKIPKIEQNPFNILADEIITTKGSINHTTDLEAKTNNLVCKLYNLTEEEIDLING